MRKLICRSTGIAVLCLASTLSAQTPGSAGEPPLHGQALVKAVIALAREGEALMAEVQKLDVDVDFQIVTEAVCTIKKRDDWLATERKGLAAMKSKLETVKRTEGKMKPRLAELTEKLAGFRKLVKEHPEASDNPIAGIDVLLETAEGNIKTPGSFLELTVDRFTDSIAKLEGSDYNTAKRCAL